MALLSLFAAARAFADLNSPAVVAGSATVATQGSTTTVNQTSARAVINWQDFSIAAGDLMRFVQPDATSATLNRVVGTASSSLLGGLEANGRIYLINPNGVLIGAGARIDTAGFLAATLDVTDADFMRGGDLLFTGDSAAAVQNLGSINALGGDIFLIARKVENAGTLHAPQGTAALAAGSEVLLTTGGDERVFVRAGTTAGEIASSGAITSATAELKAAGGNSYALAINHTGVVRATGTAVRDGQVWLVADGGAVRLSGGISAASHDGARGGEVRVLGDEVTLANGARIDVSGRHAGGTALIGGDYQGANAAVLNAEKTVIESGASIRADATEAGDGGRVIVWADGSTSFRGDISARGGVASGDGGFAEVSGKDFLNYRGTVDLRAPAGRTGTLLLDPDDIIIAASNPDLNGDGSVGPDVIGNIAAGDFPGAVSVITATEVSNILGSASLSLAATSSITVNSAVSWAAATTLTLNAGNSIAVNATINGGALGSTSLISGGTINLGASVVGSIFTLNHAGALTQTAGTVSVTQLNLQGAGNVGTSGVPLATDLGTVVLNKSGGNTFISDLGAFTLQGTSGGATTVYANNTITLGSLSSSALTVRSFGNIVVNSLATISTSGGALTLNSDAFAAGSGNITLNSDSSLISNGGNIVLGGGADPATTAARGAVYGVRLNSATLNAGTGSISIRGQATGTTGNSNYGVNLYGTTVQTSGTGGITIVGTGAPSAGNTNYGVGINTDALVQSTGGAITITGTGGGTTGSYFNDGVAIHWGGAVTSATGSISITGIAGVSDGVNMSNGVSFQGSAGKVESTGTASILISGVGTGAVSTGIYLGNATTIGGASAAGAITLDADGMDFSSGTIQGTGALTIRPRTSTTSLGLAGAAGTLNLTAAELDRIMDGFSQITFGSASTGTLTTGSYTFKDPVRFQNNNNIFFNGALATGSGGQAGTVNAVTTGSILFGTGASITTQGQAVVLHADSDSVDGGNIRIRDASITTNGGAITLGGNNDPASQPARGVVGGGHVSDMSGIYLNRATLNSGGGNISFNGRGATGSVADAAGVMIENGSSIDSGTGTISITGTGVGSNAGHIGINIRAVDAFGGASQGGSTLTSANTGSLAIHLTGTGSSSGTNSAGVVVQGASSLNASAGGSWIVGTGSGTDAANHGISLLTGASITATNELLSFTGTGGTNAQGINVTGSSTITSGSGNLSLAADTMNLAGSSISGPGTLYVRTRSAGTSLGLGDGAAGSLHLSNAELATIANGFELLDFGTGNGHGTVDVRTVAFKDAVTINVASGTGTIQVNGALSTGSGNESGAITLNAGADILVAGTGSVTTQGQAITLDSDRDNSGEGGIKLNIGSWLLSNGGNITLEGGSASNGYARGSAATDFRGIHIIGSNISSGAGNITLRGTGGTPGNSDAPVGVDIVGSSFVQTSSGSLTINGVGGAGNTALGVSIFNNAQVRTTGGGSINITGSSAATGTFAAGVNIETGASVAAQGGGGVTLTGTGSSGGAGALNHGVVIQNSSLVVASGTGGLTIQGTAGAGSSGIATLTGTNFIGNTVASNFTGPLTLTADTLSLANVLIRGAGTLLIQPLNASTTMGVGDGATGTFNLTNTELGTIQDGFSFITIGRTDSSGAMTIGTAAFKDNVTLRSMSGGSGSITVNGPLSTGSSSAAGSITLISGANTTIASGGSITTQGSNVTVSASGEFNQNAGTTIATNGGSFSATMATGATLGGTINAGAGLVTLNNAANSIDDSTGGTINAGSLRLLGTTNVTLDNATHTVGTVAGSVTGNVTLNSDALTVGTAGPTTGLNVGANNVTLRTRTGDLTLASGASIVSTAASGTSITLVSADQFINNAGASALDPGSGRFLVWSQTPVNDTRGGIPYDFKQYNATFGVTTPAQSSGNGFLYTLAPTITTSLARSVSRTYNGTDAATLTGTNYLTAGAVDSDVVTLTLPTAGTFDTRHVGTGKTVFVTGLAIDSVTNGSAAVYGYQLSTTTLSGPIGTITPATLTPGLTGTVTKVYDATTAATLANENYTLGGIFLSDVVNLNNPTSGTYDNANAGTGKTITVTGLAISGADAGNYTLSSTSASGAIGTITPKNVVVTALGGGSIYGAGGTNPGLTATGLVGGQDESVLTGLANDFAITTTTNAGSYTLSVVGTLTNGNYNVTTRNDGTWVVSPKDIVVTANGGTSIYGAGGTNPGFTATGLVNAQDESVLTGLANNFAITTATNAGSYTLAVTGTLTNGNYNVTTRDDGTWVVSPKDIVVTATGGTSTYGDSPSNPGFTATGLVNSQDVSVLTGLANNFAITNTTNAGGYTLAVTGTLTNGNYNVVTSNTGSWTVSPKDITVTANGGTSIYGAGGTNPGFTATGLVNAQDESVLTGLANNFAITTATNAGSYTLAVTGTLTNGNYNVTTRDDGTWVVSPKDIVVTATGGTSTYGDSPTNPGFTATGLVNGQDESVLTGLANNFAITNTTNAGSHTLAVTGALTNGNYHITTRNDGTWVVSPKGITVTALGGRSSYGSSPANPGFTATGLVNGQDVSVLTGLATDFPITATTTAGNYTLSVVGALTNGNYTVTARNTALWEVFGGILTITANNATRLYGGANPVFTATYSGFVGNDNASLVSGLMFTTTATASSGVGTYSITPSGAVVPNYQLVFVPGTLTITPAPLTIAAQDATRTFGAANPAFGATFTGFVNNDTSAVVSGLTFTTPATPASLVGNYAITPGGASAANYAISYLPGTLRVTAPLVIVQDLPAPVPTINNAPVMTADYAVVVIGDRLLLVPISNGRDRAPALNDSLANTLGTVATLPRMEEGTLLLGAALNALAAGGGEVVAVLGGQTGSGSGGGLALEQMPNEQGLYREATVAAGRFEVVYREVIDHVREIAATHTALGSSYYDFADTDPPRVILVRSTNNLNGEQTPDNRPGRSRE